MYLVVPTDKRIQSESGGYSTPLMTLADEYGGRAQIVEDDHCLVLMLRQSDNTYKSTTHWFSEAILALRLLLWPK